MPYITTAIIGAVLILGVVNDDLTLTIAASALLLSHTINTKE